MQGVCGWENTLSNHPDATNKQNNKKDKKDKDLKLLENVSILNQTEPGNRLQVMWSDKHVQSQPEN